MPYKKSSSHSYQVRRPNRGIIEAINRFEARHGRKPQKQVRLEQPKKEKAHLKKLPITQHKVPMIKPPETVLPRNVMEERIKAIASTHLDVMSLQNLYSNLPRADDKKVEELYLYWAKQGETKKSEREIWRKRDLDKMSIDELYAYKDKLDKVKSFRDTPYNNRVYEELGKVNKLIEETKSNQQNMLIAKATNGTLNYADTPKEIPFTLHYGQTKKTQAEEQEDKNWQLMYPYVSAKERTNGIAEIMVSLGEKPNRQKIFEEYVQYYKKENHGGVDKEPYAKYWELNSKAYGMQDEVDNILERSVMQRGKTEEYEVLNSFSRENRPLARIALNAVLKEKGWDNVKGTIVSDHIETSVETPNVQGLKAMEKLGALQEATGSSLYGTRTAGTEKLLLNVSEGKAKVRFMDPSRVSMFDGEIDVSDLTPSLQKGQHILEIIGGDKIAFSNPDIAVHRFKAPEGDYLTFKKYDVKKRVRDYETNKDRQMLVTKVFNLKLDKPTKENIEEQENIPTPKISFTTRFKVTGKAIRELLADPKGAQNLYGEAVIMEAKNRNIRLFRTSETDPKDQRSITVPALEAKESDRAMYSGHYLGTLAQITEPTDEITIDYANQMPLKATFKSQFVKGTYWVAPRIEDET